MSLGTVSVELNLDTGTFTTNIMRAGGALEKFERRTIGVSRSLRDTEAAAGAMLGRLRDLTVIAGISGLAVGSLSRAMTGWAQSIIRNNAELERMTVLLSGMSNATTDTARLSEANRQIADLIDLAGRAPFSLAALTGSLVKLKSVGQNPADLTSLVNAVAAFGGSSQQLDRASTAIQQMAGKGVVSLEELRQQLGEAIPQATALMARAAGESYGDFVNLVALGSVEAERAIAGMMSEFDRVFGGRAAELSDTWQGLMARLSTKWLEFSRIVGENDLFAEAKGSLSDLVEAFGTAEMQRFAAELGKVAAEAVELFEDMARAIIANRDAIADMATVLAIGFAGTRAIAALNALVQGFRTLSASAFGATSAITTLEQRTAVAQARLAALGFTSQSAARGLGVASVAVAGLGRTMTLAAGPLGLLVTLLGAAAGAAGFFRDEVASAMRVVNAGQLFISPDELASAEAALEALETRMRRIRNNLEIHATRLRGLPMPGIDREIAELEEEADALRRTIELSREYVRTSQIEQAVGQRMRLIVEGEREIRSAYNQTATALDQQARDRLLNEGEYQQQLADTTSTLYRDMMALYDGQIAEYRNKLTTASEADKAVIEGVIEQLQERLATYGQQFQNWRRLGPLNLIADNGAAKKVSEFEQEFRRLSITAAELAMQLDGVDAATAKLQAQFDAGLLGDGVTDTDLQKLVSVTRQIEDMRQRLSDQDDARRMADDFAEQAAQIRRSFMTAQQAAEDTIATDRAQLIELLGMARLHADERAKIEADFQQYVTALRAQAQRDSMTATDRLLDSWRDTSRQMQEATAGWLNDAASRLTDFAMTGKLKFADFAKSVIRDLIRIQIQSAMTRSASGILDSAVGWIGSAIGGSVGAPRNITPRSVGLGTGGLYHTGGIVGVDNMMPLDKLFASARRFHNGGFPGLRADEVPAILKKGEGVFTREQMRAIGGPGTLGPVKVEFINRSETPLKGEVGQMRFDGREYIVVREERR